MGVTHSNGAAPAAVSTSGRHSFSEWWWFVVRIVPFGFRRWRWLWLWFRNRFRFPNVLLAVGAGPDVSAVAVFHSPSALVLEPVVVSAQAAEVLRAGGAVGVGLAVVDVAGVGAV